MKNGGLKWIVKNAGFAIAPVIFLSLLSGAMSFVAMQFALASKTVMDVATGAVNGKLIDSCILLFALISSYIIIHIVYSVIDVTLTCRVTNRLSNNIYKKIIKSNYGEISGYHSGDLVNRLNGDVSVITAGIMGIIPTLFQLITKIIFSFTALYFLDRQFAFICIIILPFVTIAGRIYGKKMKGLHKKSRDASGKVFSYMQEGIRNLLIIKTFVRENKSSDKLMEIQNTAMKYRVKAGIISMIANLLFFAIMTCGYYCALIWCAYKVLYGLMTVGTLTAVLQLFDQLQTPFGEFSSVLPQYYQTMASVERIQEIEQIQNDNSENQKEINDFDEIVINNLSFAYDEEQVLENINGKIKKNQMTVIGGESGTGKSTLIKLMMGVIKADNGEIYFSKAGKKEICGPDTRINFAYVPQGNMILSGTVRNNITFYDDNINEEKIIESAKDACIYDFIMSLPDGFETKIGENGSGWSEGQIQRLAIARAVCLESPVVIFDEATSALDENTEREVLNNIKNKKDITSIIISHRKCAFDIADNIINIKRCENAQKN